MARVKGIHNNPGDIGKYFFGRAPIYVAANQYNVVDEAKKTILDTNYDWIGDFSSGIAPVRKDGKYAWINQNGELITNFDFSDACNVLGKARAYKNGTHYQIDPETFKVM